jgi:microcompartment protein CcmL/EutN
MRDSAGPIRTGLVAAVRTALDAGATCHLRAQYLALLSSEIVASDSSILIKLQPKFRTLTTTAWEQAYALVVMFLVEYEMAHTDTTLRREMESDPPDDANIGPDD